MDGVVRTSYSENLERELSYKTFGKKGGKLCFAFPPQNGRYWDFENFGMVECLEKWIDNGSIFLVLPDGIDGESWSGKTDCRHRIEMQEKYFRYIVSELYPEVKKLSESRKKAIATGCSMGGFHAGIFFFRRPDLFDTMISLSGTFNASMFFGSYSDDLVYDNSPAYFLPNMRDDHPYMELYRKSKIITCCGQGAWEEELLAGTRELDGILTKMNIPHFSDYWGFDVNHDWPWWKKQIVYFFDSFVFSREFPQKNR